jgi:hypothetical protein
MDSHEPEVHGDSESPAKPLFGSGAPFNHVFFQIIFPERVRSVCEGHAHDVPVVLLQLSDGRVLDLCHIELLAPRWMSVAVFRDGASCENMDTVFVPYDMITQVTLSRRDAEERHVGFQAERPLPETLHTPEECRAAKLPHAERRRG